MWLGRQAGGSLPLPPSPPGTAPPLEGRGPPPEYAPRVGVPALGEAAKLLGPATQLLLLLGVVGMVAAVGWVALLLRARRGARMGRVAVPREEEEEAEEEAGAARARARRKGSNHGSRGRPQAGGGDEGEGADEGESEGWGEGEDEAAVCVGVSVGGKKKAGGKKRRGGGARPGNGRTTKRLGSAAALAAATEGGCAGTQQAGKRASKTLEPCDEAERWVHDIIEAEQKAVKARPASMASGTSGAGRPVRDSGSHNGQQSINTPIELELDW